MFLIVQTPKNPSRGMGEVVLHKDFRDPVGCKFRPLVSFQEKAAVIIKSLGFNEDHIWDLQPVKPKTHLQGDLRIISDHEAQGPVIS